MRQNKEHFLLSELINALPPSRRSLLEQLRDVSSFSAHTPVTGARSPELADETEMVFCKKESPDLIAALTASRSKFVVARKELLPLLPPGFVEQRVFLVTPTPRLLIASLLAPFDKPSAVSCQTETIHPDAKIAAEVHLGPGAVIGADVEIEPECVIGANTVIDHATIASGTRIGFNCSIGGDGFGYEIDEETGETIKFPHFGRIQIGRRVEMGSNSCIDRGSLKDTLVEDDVKIDNLVHIAHNCHIHQGAIIIANAMIGGSVSLGEYTWIAPSASVINGVSVGKWSMVGLGAVVTKSVGENELLAGVPAKKLRDRLSVDSALLRR